MHLNPNAKPTLIFLVTCEELGNELDKYLDRYRRLLEIHVVIGRANRVKTKNSIINILIRKYKENLPPTLIHIFLITGWSPDQDVKQQEFLNRDLPERIYELTKRAIPPTSEIDIYIPRVGAKISDVLARTTEFITTEYLPLCRLLNGFSTS